MPLKIDQKELKIGYSIALEANKRLREIRVEEWKQRNNLIAESMPNGDAKKEALLTELKVFFDNQIPVEQEVRNWCYSTEGLLFCFKTAGSLSDADARSGFDDLSDEQMEELRYDVRCVFQGKLFADAVKKDQQRIDDDSRKQGEIGFAEYQELMTAVWAVYGTLGHKETIIALGEVLDKADKAEKAKKKDDPLAGQKELF